MSFRIFSFIFLLISFSSYSKTTPQKRQIIKDQFTIEFYISSSKKVKKPSNRKTYTWYKSGNIFASQGEIGGDVLEGSFTKRFTTNQLAEKGNYKGGLKDGIWKTWYPNGSLQTIVSWKKGVKAGSYKTYSESGKPQILGKYKQNRKNGKWIFIDKKDTTFFKKGNIDTKKLEYLKKKEEKKKYRHQVTFKERAKIFFSKLFSPKKKSNKKLNNKKASKNTKNKATKKTAKRKNKTGKTSKKKAGRKPNKTEK